jgi:hypothetical protein
LVQITPFEAVVHRAVAVAVARHCSRFRGEKTGEKVVVNTARRGRSAINRRPRINSHRRVEATRSSATGFYRGRRLAFLADKSGPPGARELSLDVSRAFVSSGHPERAPRSRGWPGLAGWMKAQIRAKTRNRGHV